MNAKSALAGAALYLGVLSSAPASAAVSWGSHDAYQEGTTSSLVSSFDFTLSHLSTLFTSVVTTSGGGLLGLFKDDSTIIGGFVYNPDLPGTATFANLAPGAYSYKVLNVGGPASVVSVLAAVPEPEAYVMLLAGLGMIALVARRRMTD